MKVIADLEVHSKYARAVSPQMTLPTIAEWADKKGINLIGTGDFTHPIWLRELDAGLEEAGNGIYKLKNSESPSRFLLTSEVSCMYSHKGKGRRIHILVYLSSLAEVRKFNKELTLRGANLFSDGRPIIGLTLAQLSEIALSVNPQAIIIPAHVWTPWFGFYGDKSGYDSLFEAFGQLEKYIPAVETGLSSDPAMNWRIGELANRRIVSFSDAHSPQKLGREATVFQIKKSKIKNQNDKTKFKNINYSDIYDAIHGNLDGDWEIGYTIEFYPEEGKYHYTGHRDCKVVYSPNEARKKGITCPVCGRPLTVGVMSRVEHLASQEIEIETELDEFGVRWIKSKVSALRAEDFPSRRPYVMLVPLSEILSEALASGPASQKVLEVYEQLVSSFGSEFAVLLETNIEDIKRITGDRVSQAVAKVRRGDIVIEPGYDGIFGKVAIWREKEEGQKKEDIDQGTLFG